MHTKRNLLIVIASLLFMIDVVMVMLIMRTIDNRVNAEMSEIYDRSYMPETDADTESDYGTSDLSGCSDDMEVDKVTETIINQDELKETDTAVGAVNEDRGVDDIIDAASHANIVVVEEIKPEPPKEDDNKVFTSVEQMPVYPGGDAALFADVSKNIIYPSVAQENGIEGKVVVQFVVTKNGTVGEVKVVRGKDPDLDKEAKRVVKTLKKFTPGEMNGNPVNVWYTLPVIFKLPENIR